MSKETKKADKTEDRGDELVMIQANPKLFPASDGNIVVNNRVVPKAGVQVTRRDYEVMRNVELRGYQAVVLMG